jgi:hypothetical protein
MTDSIPNPILLEKVLRFALIELATPTIRRQVVAVLRALVLEETQSASPRVRRELIEAHEAAFDYLTSEYLIQTPPQPTFIMEQEVS